MSDDTKRAELERLGGNLKRFVERKGWTLRELARQSGETQNRILRFANGESEPGTLATISICRALGITVEELVGRPETPKKTAAKKLVRI